MKLKNVAIVAAALALAVGMTACGSSASSTASSAASSTAASSEAASSEAASSEAASSEAEAEAQAAEYTVYNTTGANVTELYLYEAGSEDKGENLAADGLADGDSVVLTLPEDADQSAKYILEFTTEDGTTQSFETLRYEVTPISLLSADAAAGATPIAFSAPEQ